MELAHLQGHQLAQLFTPLGERIAQAADQAGAFGRGHLPHLGGRAGGLDDPVFDVPVPMGLEGLHGPSGGGVHGGDGHGAKGYRKRARRAALSRAISR